MYVFVGAADADGFYVFVHAENSTQFFRPARLVRQKVVLPTSKMRDFLGFFEARFRALQRSICGQLLRDVAPGSEARVPPASKGYRRGNRLDVDERSVFSQMMVHALELAGRVFAEQLEDDVAILIRSKLIQGHRQQLFARIAVHLDRCIIYRENFQGLTIVYPRPLRHPIEQYMRLRFRVDAFGRVNQNASDGWTSMQLARNGNDFGSYHVADSCLMPERSDNGWAGCHLFSGSEDEVPFVGHAQLGNLHREELLV